MFALASLLMPACTKEINTQEPLPQEPAEQSLVPICFKAGMEGGVSRTTLDAETGSVAWTATDAVKFMWDLGGNKDGNASGSAVSSETTLLDEGVASFTAEVNEDFNNATTGYSSRHMYAVYPATTEMYYYSNYDDYEGELPSTNGQLYVKIPTAQTGLFADASIALAKWSSPSEQLEFKNLCGLLQVKVADASVKYIKVSSDEYIAGLLNITFTRTGYDGLPVEKEDAGVVSGSQEITVTIAEPVSAETTYYVAVRPCDISNLYVSLYDADNNLIGDKMSGNVLSVARRQIRKLGTLATGFDDRLYFTPDGAGSKDGSSWDNAGDVALLRSTLVTAVTKNLYLAEGDYLIQNVAGTQASKFKIYGGYPDDASGYAISGRDISANESRIYNNAGRTFYINNANASWLLDGLTFESTGYANANGCALTLINAASLTVNNCQIKNSSISYSKGGGAVRIACNATFTNCAFSGNSSTGTGSGAGGGAIYMVGGTAVLDNCTFSSNSSSKNGGAIVMTGGDLTAVNCDFSENTAVYGGGAIFTGGSALLKMDCCTFRTNTTTLTDNSGVGGGALWITETSKLFMNRCFLANNSDQYNAHAIYSGVNSWVGLNNCVVRAPWGVTKTQGSLLQVKGYNVVVNSTLYCQIGSWGVISLGSKDADGCRIINDIVINQSTSQYSFYCTSYYMQLYNTICSVIRNASEGYGATDPDGTCITGASTRSGGNFPTSDAIWTYNEGSEIFYYNSDKTRYGYCYPWEGTTDAGTLTMNSLSGIKTLISGTTNIGADFLAWLESDDLKVDGVEALAVDIRGVARDTDAMWPGSYQAASSRAGLENFRLR